LGVLIGRTVSRPAGVQACDLRYVHRVLVRPMVPAEEPLCLDLFESVVGEGRWLASEPPVDRGEVAGRWRALRDGGEGIVLVADPGGAPAGLAVMSGRARPELGMLVAAAHRRRGVGDALVDACLAWARGVGAREVVLHVFPHNTAAAALYRKHGFEDRGLLLRAYRRRSGERWDAIRMVKAF
jgi:RimJ/RimL family protein N-acetyltransferase